MPVSRMRMRPWLEEQINSRRVEGLEWLDEEKTMFSIPWKHAARHGWQMEKDANLFQKWAVHTGKFKSGSTPDPKTWKANFRCAMNSLPDIEEVKNQSVNKGCGAVRVYRMLPEVHKKKDKRSKSRQERRKAKDMDASQVKAEESNMCEESTDRLPTGKDMTQENTVDSTIQRDIFDDEIPYGSTEEITPDSTDRWTGTFQVSPQHSTDFEEEDAIRRITEQLERDQPQWITSDINGRDYLSNEIGTTPDSSNSPQSQWSETSGEEVELQLVTELVSKFSPDMSQELIQMWPMNTVY